MASKKIFFISDLHLGVGEANDFHKTFQLHRFLDFARKNADEFVICGDFLELLQSELAAIYVQHHEIFEHLFDVAREIKVSYVVGNHDALVAIDYRPEAPSRFFGSDVLVTPEYENLELEIFAAHGHQFCEFNKKADILDLSEGSSSGDRIANAIGWIENHGAPKIDNWLGWLEDAYVDYKIVLRKLLRDTKKYSEIVDPSSPNYEKLGGDFSEFERGAADVLASSRYSVCVFGHTHDHKIRHLKDGIYVNTGSWVHDDPIRSPAVFAAVDSKKVELVDAETFEVLDSFEREFSVQKNARKIAAKK